MESKGERGRCSQLNAEFQRIAKGDKKAFLNEEYNEVEKTTYLIKKIREIKRTLHARKGTISDRNSKDVMKVEEIKKK